MKNLLFKVDDATELRANISRHMFLWHDMFHILFRYDTSIFGEALVQKVTCKASR